MKLTKYALFALLFVGAKSINAQKINTLKLDSLFQILDENKKFMGSVALSQNGKVLYTKSIGWVDKKANLTADEETKYRIGSISKMFTSVLIFQSIEKGDLKLDDTIEKYFPNIKNGDKITIQDLLNHHSGIVNFTNDPSYLSWCSHPISKADLLQKIISGGSDFEPGTKGEYSNSNYVLLAMILEKNHSKEFAEIVNENIINRIQLSNTSVGGKIDSDNNEAYSYKLLKDWFKDMETDMSVPLGAGSIISTPNDLNKFASALFNGELISVETLAEMTKLNDNLGHGIFRFPYNKKWGYGHGGRIDSFDSFLFYIPEDKLSCAIIRNGGTYDNNDIVIRMMASYYGDGFNLPTFGKKQPAPSDLSKYIGVYVTDKMPLKITVTEKKALLYAQATGQGAFTLDYVGDDTFTFDPSGIKMEFNPEKNEFTLNQGGGKFLFKKEN